MKQILITRDRLYERMAFHLGKKCASEAHRTGDFEGWAVIVSFMADVMLETLDDLFDHSCNSADDNIFKEKEG